MQVESLGYFAGPILSQDRRWRSGSIYVFVISTISADLECSGSARGFAESEGVRERFMGETQSASERRSGKRFGTTISRTPWPGASNSRLRLSSVRSCKESVAHWCGLLCLRPATLTAPSLASPVSNTCSVLTQVHTPLVETARGAAAQASQPSPLGRDNRVRPPDAQFNRLV